MKSTLMTCVAAIFVPLSAVAQAASSDELVKQLSPCDATFFRALKANAASLQGAGPLTDKGDVSFWKVPNRAGGDDSVVMFAKPIEGKVKLVGYFDDFFDLQADGRYYNWGFLANGTPESIATAIKPLIEGGARLRKDGPVYVRSEIRHVAKPGSQWEINDSLAGGTVPQKGTVERVFIIEDAGSMYPGVSRINCSLQGSVTPELLASERPDIE